MFQATGSHAIGRMLLSDVAFAARRFRSRAEGYSGAV